MMGRRVASPVDADYDSFVAGNDYRNGTLPTRPKGIDTMAERQMPREKRAEAYLTLLSGATIEETAKKHNISRSTAIRWKNDIEATTGQGTRDIRASQFERAVQDAATKFMRSMEQQAEFVSNPEWLHQMTATGNTNDVINLTAAIAKAIVAVVQFAQSGTLEQPQLPDRTLEAEIVPED